LYWCECFFKLLVREPGITVEVKAPHDSDQLVLERLVTDKFKIPSQRLLIDELVVLTVNCLEHPSDIKASEVLDVLLDLLEAQLKVDLLGKQDGKLTFCPLVKIVNSQCSACGSLGNFSTQSVVVTW